MKDKIYCDRCGKEIYRYPSQLKKHNFCSRDCLAEYSNKQKNPELFSTLRDSTNTSRHMTELNCCLNPTRMTPEIRAKVRAARLNSGEGVTYTKYYGRLAHRVVAEKILGRPLKENEVVHHMDFNRRNNNENNLMIFASNADHNKYHGQLRSFFALGKIPDEPVKEVMPDDVQTS